MTVTISKPAINIREQLTELKAQQGYEERQFYFDGLVTNGTFDADTDWTKVQTTISGGQATITDGSSNGSLRQNCGLVSGKVYNLQYELVSKDTGAIVFLSNADNNSALGTLLFPFGSASTGIYNQTFTSTGSWVNFVCGGSDNGSVTIDNISVYEVDPNDSNKVIHTMPKGWKPLHVFEDGALQREGSAYDYTVEYDGFNYVVKETVAPVAPYSTTVIGVRA